MSHSHEQVQDHYEVGQLLDSILNALTEMGKDPNQLVPADLAPVDEFHTRGRQATIELATLAQLKPDLRILDVGCGLGGSVRYLASEHGCHTTGIDLIREYVDVATALAQLVGLSEVVTFHHGSALDLPFEDESFDVAWTEHAQMNIEHKAQFYGEIARVLKSKGRFAFHDVFQGDGGEPHYPVPWAEQPSISFLAPTETVRRTLDQLGFEILHWVDTTQQAITWFDGAIERIRTAESSPLGLHLLMGKASQQKFTNQIQNLKANRVVILQAVARKT
ncbi:MAG TPA: methyltransferase domain-containing protein [Nitrospirales bacterium]|nr:methyltransferase domain-containing protein [Nitrospirales bacterium]